MPKGHDKIHRDDGPLLRHDLSHISEPKEEEKKGRSKTTTVLIAVVISVLIHLLFIAAGALMPKTQNLHAESQPPMRARLVSKPQEKKSDSLQKQVVTIAPPKESIRPKEAELLSEYDSKVKEQTLSRVTSPNAPVSDRPMSQMHQPQKPDPNERKLDSKPKVEPKTETRLSKNGILAKQQEKQASRQLNLVPTWKDDSPTPGMPFNDHVSNVAQDIETRLNTLEWRHATFFNRVKEAIARRWKPNSAIRRNDPRGELIGKQDRLTQITARIDQEGKLVSIAITRDSGVYYLDDEALRAFKEAAPFSNPPKALFGSNDTFEFPFGFILTNDRGFNFDLDWKPY